ncbi:DNA methyltransferase [Treponema pedis]|uniref:Methyltransferase n=1 Tax=Treponema pedis str. T A4 TaxID=1291379 RepID=S5ZSR4_9SPIR|nr:DNA methyltransferase [Treponema pedis]AGT43140.1 DNA methylase N-4/N-6 domain-containing protein [Treponema pedis str. T A4]QSI03981.1 RNA methyltransferase [Treponema pedis]
MASKKSFIDLEKVRAELQKYGVENIDSVIEKIEKQVKTSLNSYKEKNKIAREQYKEAVPFLEIYKSTEGLNLPNWVLEKIDEARILGNSKQMIIFPDGEKYQINNPLNNLSGGEWLDFTTSVFSTFYTTNGKDSYAHEIRKLHPTPKPPQLMKEIIEFFTKENEIVFDYFMGVGGSLLGAGLSNRRAVGIDLNQKYIDAYKLAAKEIGVKEFKTICGDCIEVLSNENQMKNLFAGEKISLVLLDPPYANMMSKEKTGADINVYGNIATPFTDDKRDFGNLSVDEFYDSLKKSVELVLPYIKKHGYIVVFVKDLQPVKKETNLLHANIIQKINEIQNVNYKGLKIWSDRSAKLFPYGYPFSFVANQIHQYIMVFRKEK